MAGLTTELLQKVFAEVRNQQLAEQLPALEQPAVGASDTVLSSDCFKHT